MNPKCLYSLASIRRFVNVPPLPRLKNFAQRLSHRAVVLLAGNFFLRWTVESDQMIISDSTFLGIKFRKRFWIGKSGVENDDGLSRQIVRCVCAPANNYEQEHEPEHECFHQKLSFSPS